MRRFDWRWLAVSSVWMVALAAVAETRPQYGGTLHVATRAAPTALDPAEMSAQDSFAQRSVTLLIFDTLIAIDENGRPQPSLATSWQSSQGNQRWQLRLRRGVRFHDGTPLTTELAAASLRAANPVWNVSADADSIVIECETADPELPSELALPRNAIAKRNSNSNDKPIGTGPFHVVDWQPGKKLTLAAEENYWRGRPFLDAVEIEMGKSFRDQMMELEMGRADLVEVAPEQSHRVSLEGRHVVNSAQVELLAVLFTRDAQTPEEKSLREALALSIDRSSICSVLLQGAGQPAASVLPDWMSGYGFVFPVGPDLPRARHAREQVPTIPTWTLGYDASDPLARLLAERIALNAKDAGLSLQPVSSSSSSLSVTVTSVADLRLVRIPLASADPWVALAEVAALTGSPIQRKSTSVEDLYAAEQTLLATQRIVPLVHLPASSAARLMLKNWTLRSDGNWGLADAWLGASQP
jgi:peptide/nickel transport system substrate-binding protein